MSFPSPRSFPVNRGGLPTEWSAGKLPVGLSASHESFDKRVDEASSGTDHSVRRRCLSPLPTGSSSRLGAEPPLILDERSSCPFVSSEPQRNPYADSSAFSLGPLNSSHSAPRNSIFAFSGGHFHDFLLPPTLLSAPPSAFLITFERRETFLQ